MKILLIHTSYQQKGGEDVVFSLEKEALKEFHEVKTLHFQNNKGLKGALQFLVSIWNIKNNKIVKNKIISFSPDLIHLHNFHFALGPLVIREVKKMKIPLVLTLHNFRLICPSGTLFHQKLLFTKSIQQNFPLTAIKNKVYRNSYIQTFWLAFVIWFHKKINTFNLVDAFVCPSPFMVDFFKKSTLIIDENKYFVKPNFSQEFKKPAILIPKNNFLFVGRLSEEKGIVSMVEAFKNSNNVLKIVGKGPLMNFVKDSSTKYKNIIYLGFLSKEEVALEMQQANALIFPSIWFEPFGLTIIEAFSNNCAVIASNIGAPKTLIKNGKNGFHFNVNDSNSLKRTLQNWNDLTNIEKQEVRLNAYKSYQENYTAQKHKSFTNDFYKSILK